MELLVEVIEDPGSAELRTSALRSIFQLVWNSCMAMSLEILRDTSQISSPSIWRESNNRLCESNLEDPHGTLYSRLGAVSVGDRYFPCKVCHRCRELFFGTARNFLFQNVLPLITLIVSWSRFLTSLTQLEISAKEMFSAISGAAHFNEVPVSEFTEKWNDFQIR